MIQLSAIAFTILVAASCLGSLPAAAGTYRLLYAFQGTDGSNPLAGLINVNGTLYGTTFYSGLYGWGTIFSLNLATGSEKTVYSFQGGSSDGGEPKSDLILHKDKLFGTTFNGGSQHCIYGCGVVFSVDPQTGVEQTIYIFQGNTDGANPTSSLTAINGLLYGTTQNGGTYDAGTVFSIDPSTGVEKVIYSFQGGSDGANPYSRLIQVGSKLYGTTQRGGSSGTCGGQVLSGGCGTVYTLDLSSGVEKVVYAFVGGIDGYSPLASLNLLGNTLYGTTEYGGTQVGGPGRGVVYSIDIRSGTEKVVSTFQSGGGASPYAKFARSGHTFFGTTYGGGTGNGAIVSFVPATGVESVLYSFQGGSSSSQSAAKLTLVNGTFYGTTAFGGNTTNCVNSCGTVFAYTP